MRQKKNRFFGITSRVLMFIVAALLALSYVSIVINPAQIWVASIFGILFVPLMILNVLLLLWAVKRKSKTVVIPLLALLPSFFFISRYVKIDTGSLVGKRSILEKTSEAPKDTIKVVTWNVGRFRMHDKDVSGRQQCMDSVFHFIEGLDADIICLQEFHIKDDSQVRSFVNRKMKGYDYEYFVFEESGGHCGNLTLSRFRAKGNGTIKFDGSANLAIYTDYEVNDRRFRVYNCHFESYNISFTGLIRAIARRDSVVMAETGTKMKRSITRRPRQVDKVFSDIENCPVESFVCGDFNDNPMSYTYHRMTRDRKDAFVEAGSGFGATHSLLWPMLRIDYVLYPENYRAVSHEIPRVPFSDHYPVVAEIEL